MRVFDVGEKCLKVAGRKAGERVTVTKVVDRNFVEVEDGKGKKKRCNIRHLEPLKESKK